MDAINSIRFFAHTSLPKAVKVAILARVRQGMSPEEAKQDVASGMALSGYNLDGTPIDNAKSQTPPPYRPKGAKRQTPPPYTGPMPPPYRPKGQKSQTPPPYNPKGGKSQTPPPYNPKGNNTQTPPPYKGRHFSSTNYNQMDNTLNQQINETRNYLFQNRMYSELEGFDTALRMFADASKKSFKDKAAEVWKKHKGKIIAGAALAAAAGTGAHFYNKQKQKEFLETELPQKIVDELKSATKEARIKKFIDAMEGQSTWYGKPWYAPLLKWYKYKYPDEYAEAEKRRKEEFYKQMEGLGTVAQGAFAPSK
jgi:hypothetical protein